MTWPPRGDAMYRPAAGEEYWRPEIECAPPAERDALPFYRRTWQGAGVGPDALRTLADLAFSGRAQGRGDRRQ